MATLRIKWDVERIAMGPPSSPCLQRQSRAATQQLCRASDKHCSIYSIASSTSLYKQQAYPEASVAAMRSWRHCCSSAQQRCSRQLRDASTPY